MEQNHARSCNGQHDIYVAEVFYVSEEGKAVVITVCRACDSVKFHEQIIAQPQHGAVALKTEKEK